MQQILDNISQAFNEIQEKVAATSSKAQVWNASVEAVKERLGGKSPDALMLPLVLAHRTVTTTHLAIQLVQQKKAALLAGVVDRIMQDFRTETLALAAQLDREIDEAIREANKILAKLDPPKN